MDDKILIMIDSYIDGELSRGDEDILFGLLAVNPEARNYLRKVNLVVKQTQLSAAELPHSLEKNILNGVNRRSVYRVPPGTRIGGYISASISIILLIVSLFLLRQVSDYRAEINSVLNQMQKQNQMIQALYYSYPAAEVHARYSNEIIVKPNI